VVYVGGFENYTLYALNASTGTLLWSYDTGGAVFSSPAVANGIVYVSSDGGDLDALNAITGAKLWSYTTGGPVTSSPAVADGVVYIGSSDGNVYALNANTGGKLWSYSSGGPVSASPAVANGVVYIGSNDGNLYALNAGTGTKLWSYDTGNPVDSGLAVANGVVYAISEDISIVMGGSYLYALNASTGTKLWSYLTSSLSSSPAVVDGLVYVRAGYFVHDGVSTGSNVYAFSVGADLFLRIRPIPETVHQGDLITYAFPVWNLGPEVAEHELLMTQVPPGTTFDYIRISGTPGLGTCTTPPYQGTGPIVCHENASMAPNTTWTVRLTVKVTAFAGTVITENAATMADTPDPNLANNMATVSLTVQ
jgi:outer membrane protein assembly factor BamB